MMDPKTSLETCENALRELMQYRYRAEIGEDWLATVSNSDQRRSWKMRHDAEQEVRPGVASLPALGLAYSDLTDLVTIARKYWSELDGALGEREMTLPLLVRFDELRNSVAHNRRLVAFERELLAGIAGQIRNQVTIYMSSQDPSGEYYPRIESITDSYGHTFTPSDLGKNEAYNARVEWEITVGVGEQVRFACVGTDPQGRELVWELTHANIGYCPPYLLEGNEVEFVWEVGDEHVRWNPTVVIEVGAKDAPHHRYTKFDAKVDWAYREVRPAQA
ncbi:hypothetical protein [Tsukamurella columbiensis]|uniref:Swt1-like HEPN domain-containing protein n=1 Tax=Tsukamurella columbiensis TaxID=128509 RepID=A0ABX1LKQ5_9ACTN|nr:hypothetical protein [Tsukamurella columbiensis]NMD58309.1 hypothetical protein [Tsukamurella columbiensis]